MFWMKWTCPVLFGNKQSESSANCSYGDYFLNTFSNVLPNDDEKIDRLFEEFTDYKTFSIFELPDTVSL